MSILISRDMPFIVQGITGREAVNLTRENLDYGAKIVGGVTPGRAGREVYGVPVYDSVRDIVQAYGEIEGSVVCVPPRFTKDAVFEALENGVKLIVVVTENVPRREVAQMVELASLRGTFSVTTTMIPMPFSMASKTASRVNFGGTQTTEPVTFSSRVMSRTQSKTGTP